MTKYIEKERAKYWPVSLELMSQYRDGSHSNTNSYGSLEWWQNGKLHRNGDKPAVIRVDGRLAWWQNGQRHRICGPAVITAHGRLQWWTNGKNITREVNAWLAGEEWQGTPEQIVEFKLRFS